MSLSRFTQTALVATTLIAGFAVAGAPSMAQNPYQPAPTPTPTPTPVDAREVAKTAGNSSLVAVRKLTVAKLASGNRKIAISTPARGTYKLTLQLGSNTVNTGSVTITDPGQSTGRITLRADSDQKKLLKKESKKGKKTSKSRITVRLTFTPAAGGADGSFGPARVSIRRR